ncbi:MAG: N-acetyl sugar amidotransferase [Euryarchaeota archaeon]|nr:N-acetyl sugar amidotransferase [Euryarchaeota archaeon]
MDTSDPDIRFDEDGNCNHCEIFLEESKSIKPQGLEREQRLKDLIESIKKSGKNKKYDCLIGVSGGTDSSYVAYIVKELGLRPLAVHMDNGWNSEESVKNIRNLCTRLNIDYESYVLDWDEFKDIQLSVLKSSIVEVEIPTDVAIVSILHKVASRNNIKYIIGGGNYATEGILPDLWFYNPKDLKLLKSIQKQFGSKKIKTFPTFDWKAEIFYKFIKRIRMVYLLNLLPYDKQEALSILKDKVGYHEYGGKHHESVYTRFIQSYFQPVKFNLDYRRATLSSQICSGSVTREEALKQLEELPYNIPQVKKDKDYVSKKFGITLQEFESILNAPPKSYKDYPNDEKWLTFIYNLYKKYINA